MNLIEAPAIALGYMGSIAFFFIFAKIFKWKLDEWQSKTYWLFITVLLITFIGEAFYRAIIL